MKLNKILFVFIHLFIGSFSFGQTTAVPDANFEQALIDLGYDSGIPDGSVPTANISGLTALNVANKNIADLTGIEDFLALTNLQCNLNQLLFLDLSTNIALTDLSVQDNILISMNLLNNTALEVLNCGYNQLTGLSFATNINLIELYVYSNALMNLDISNNLVLSILDAGYNDLTSLDVSQNTLLTELNCYGNYLTDLNVLNNINLVELICYTNQLSSLDVSSNTQLTSLWCGYNQLTSLDVSNNVNLVELACNTNQLISLDLSSHAQLSIVWCGDNQLVSLNIGNGNNAGLNQLNTTQNSGLFCIQVDDPVYSSANWTGGSFNFDSWASFSSYCSCPAQLSIDSVLDVFCSSLGYASGQLITTNGPVSYLWNTVPVATDSFAIISTQGVYTLTASDALGCSRSKGIVVNGPEFTSAFDLEVQHTISGLRPGASFDLNLIGINNSCIATSAQLKMRYDTSILHLINLVPSPSQIIGDTMYWDVANLIFDTSFVINLSGYVDSNAIVTTSTCFNLCITPTAGDVDSANNFRSFCRPIINSYDPNDKSVYPKGICTANYIESDQLLTYTIRFQNTGTADAININIIDSLNPYLDINTLKVVTQSHSGLITEVYGDSVLNFVFNNINLPDSATNEPQSHGYVIYEIMPLAGLPNGTVIENMRIFISI
ncbi:MAG: hypothetical protein JKY54_04320 [Flavobacteriales bacterium]|nr:hypothetical protein [Flavobacteriales bacterium]